MVGVWFYTGNSSRLDIMKKLIIVVIIVASIVTFVLTQFTHIKQPTEVLNPGTITTKDDWCFSSWCGDGWKKKY